jgi:hypothetical protein
MILTWIRESPHSTDEQFLFSTVSATAASLGCVCRGLGKPCARHFTISRYEARVADKATASRTLHLGDSLCKKRGCMPLHSAECRVQSTVVLQ